MAEQVVQIATSVLKKNPLNPKYFSDLVGKERDTLKQSIKEDGVINPLIITSGMVIVSGHQRFDVCVELEYETVPCIIRDDITDEKDVERLLIASNFGRSDKSGPLFRKALASYVELCGYKRGGDRKSKGQNAPLKSRKEIADDAGISEDTLNRLLRLDGKLSPEIADLLDNNDITQATALLVCKLTPEEQLRIFNTLEFHSTDNPINEQLKAVLLEKEKIEVTLSEYEKKVVQQEDEINELVNREPEQVEVEVPPKDYEDVKNANKLLHKEIADLKAQLVEAFKAKIITHNNNVSGNDEITTFLISCTIDDVPSADDIDTVADREQLLDENPDLLLSQISSVHQSKRIAYRILERALGITDEKNHFLISWDNYATLICDYNGSNFPKLAAKVQKYKTNKR